MTTEKTSPAQGVASDDGIVEESVLSAIRGKLQGHVSEDKLTALMGSDFPRDWQKDPQAAVENLLKDPAKYLKEIKESKSAESQPAPEGSTAPAEQAKPQAKPKVKVALEIDPEALGTYAKNRKPDEAVLEMMKGIGIKDNLIQEQRGRLSTFETKLAQETAEKARLQKELEEARRVKTPEQPPTPALKKVELPKRPELPTDGDILDPEYQKKLAEYEDKRDAALMQTVEDNRALREEIAQVKGGVTKVSERMESAASHAKAEETQQNELEEIDRLRKAYTGKGLSFERPFKQIEDDWMAFVREAYKASGATESNILTPEGLYKPEVLKVIDNYYNETEGKDLREKCKAAEVAPPKDAAELSRVYDIRAIQQNNFTRGPDGKYIPYTYDQAWKLYASQHLDVNEIKIEASRKGQEAFERAVANRREFAREPDPSRAGAPVDLSKMDQSTLEGMVKALITKGVSRTAEESETLKYILTETGHQPHEIKHLMSTD